MTVKVVERVNTRSSKADEINLLQDFAARCESGSYLSSLLNPKLVQWVENQIDQDSFTNVYDAYEASLRERQELTGLYEAVRAEFKEATRTAASAVEALRDEVATLRAQNEELNALNCRIVEEVNERGDRWTTERTAMQAKLDGLRGVAARAWLDGRAVDPADIRDALR